MLFSTLLLSLLACDSLGKDDPPYATRPELCEALEAESSLWELGGEDLVLTCLPRDRAVMEWCEDEASQLTIPSGAMDEICRRCEEAGWDCLHWEMECEGFEQPVWDAFCGRW